MPKVSPIQNNFNSGELSPLLYGRSNHDNYRSGLAMCVNHIPLVQGGVTRRPGTQFVAEVKNSAKVTRLVSFEFSTTQAYIIEFGDQYLRFYRDRAQILDGGPAYEIASPWLEADLEGLRFTQSADILYVTHNNYAPRKVSRTGHTNWTISTIVFRDGPYLPVNITATTITPSGTSGAITLSASAALWAATDVGRLVRIQHGSTWGNATITGFTSNVLVNATVNSAFGAASASAAWRHGAWSGTTGFPAISSFFEDRLFLAASIANPQTFWGSRTGDYENFAPSGTDGVIASDHGITATLNSNDVQVIRWIVDDEKGMLVGTTRGEWIVRPSSQAEALTPTNVTAKQSLARGSANTAPVKAGKPVLFVQRAGRKLRELAYVFEVDGFRAPDMTVLSEHITKGGIKILAYQQEPQSVVWAPRNDGTLLGFTYERDQEVLGWHRHELGGSFSGGIAVVESIAVIPEPGGTYDDLWMIVKRTIDGGTKRYIEFLTKIFETGDDQRDAFYVDSGLTYDGAPVTTITGLDHLEGQTVAVLTDGAAHPDRVVSSGQITLALASSIVTVGLAFRTRGQMLRIEAGAADGTAQGKTQRTHRIGFRVHNTLGLKAGPSFEQMVRYPMRTSSDLTGEAVPLFSGDIIETWEGEYTTENYVCWEFDQPLPGTILAVMPHMHTQDR